MLDSQAETSNFSRRRFRGFSFAEVMFAVVILGIGFIMVAAIFPVAIQQTQQTSDDSASASVAREASNAIAALPFTIPSSTSYAGQTVATITYPSSFPLLPPTVKNYFGTGVVAPPAVMVPFVGARFNAIAASLILPSNPRLAYIPFYMRDNTSSVAQMVVVAVATQNQSTYAAKDISPVYGSATSITTAAGAYVAGQVSPGTITINNGPAFLGEGCFVTVAQTTPPTPQSGRTYVLGRKIQVNLPIYEMLPSDGLSEATGNTTGGVTTDDGLWNTKDDTIDPAAASLASATVNYPSTLQPTAAYAKFSFPSDSTSGRITLSATLASALAASTTPNNNLAPLSADPGAFIIVADDDPYAGLGDTTNYAQRNSAASPMYPLPTPALPPSPTNPITRLNGHIYRLGAAIAADTNNPPGTYELDPAYGLSDVPATTRNLQFTAMKVVSDAINDDPYTKDYTTGNTVKYNADIWARVYIAGGRALSNTADPTSAYTGPAQGIAAYSTFIPVK